jgi:hypothetical protein
VAEETKTRPKRVACPSCGRGGGFLQIAFGNQTVSRGLKTQETHGFASLPRGRFALIVCNRLKELAAECADFGGSDNSIEQ